MSGSMTFKCVADGYGDHGHGETYDSADEFLDMCRTCFDEVPELHQKGTSDWYDSEGVLVLQAVEPVPRAYVRDNQGEYWVQVPDANPWGFLLLDEDSSHVGGLGTGAKSWQIVQPEDMPANELERLAGLIDYEPEADDTP